MADGRIRVVHVIGRIDVGGIQKAVLALIRELPSFSHTVIFTDVETAAMYPEYAAVVETIQCPYPRAGPGFLLRLAKLLRKLAPDVVVAHLFGNHTLVSWAAFLAGVPATFGVSNNDPTWAPFSRSRRARWKPMLLAQAARPFCRGEIAVSHAVARILTSVLRLPAGRIHVVTNGCRVEDIAAAAGRARSASPPSAERVPRVLMVGAMMRSKDHATLFQAIELLRRQGRPMEVWLAGDGYLRGEREALVERLGLGGQVRFLGNRGDVPELLGAADVLVHATISEGFGLVLIEAMAAGTPIVASDIAACREVLDEGRCGLLVQPRDPEALAQSIVRILDDGELRGRLAAAASERVRALYDLQHTAAGYAALISGLGEGT